MGTNKELEYEVNPFGGVIVLPGSLPETASAFGKALQKAIEDWRRQEYTSIWLEIPKGRANLIPVAADLGFEFHHCETKYLMLAYQLAKDSFLPPYATHYAGVGGVVINKSDELLVVVEQADRENRPNYYKLPGGALLQGEHIVDAAIREVLEETGVATRFESMVCIRHWHNYRYGKSDLYFVSRLSPIDEEIAIQQTEIYKCEWMLVDNFLKNKYVGVFSKRIVACALTRKGMVSSCLEGYNKDRATREILLPLTEESHAA